MTANARPLSEKRPINITVLILDALYYHAAFRSFQRARTAEPELRKDLQDFEPLQALSEAILREHGGSAHKAYDQLEPIYIQMDGTSEQIGFAYTPVLEGVASTHILCASALESHINARASELLSGKIREKFERVDLEFKWLLLPKLTGYPGFDPGAEPFQGFSRLIRLRNALIHYRERREPCAPNGVPAFLSELGLTLEDASRSLASTSRMIESLANQLGQDTPLLAEAGSRRDQLL